MAVRLNELRADERTLTVDVGSGAELTLRYRPSAITAETEDRLHELAQEQRNAAGLVALLAQVLVGWDLLDDDGAEIPPTPERLRQLPVRFLGQLMQAIGADMRPNP